MPFPTPIGQRISYDRDGTKVFIRTHLAAGGRFVEVHPIAAQAMNSTNGSGLIIPHRVPTDPWFRTDITSPRQLLFLFPVPMDLFGIMLCSIQQFGGLIGAGDVITLRYYVRMRGYVSRDTTNGVDGRWVSADQNIRWTTTTQTDNIASTISTESPPVISGIHALTGELRTAPNGTPTDSPKRISRLVGPQDGSILIGQTSVVARGITGLLLDDASIYTGSTYDIANSCYSFIIHLYGRPSLVETSAVAAWHPIQNVVLPPGYLSFEGQRLSSETKQFRVKNHSVSEAASDVLISAEDEWSALSPSPASSLQFSLDGSSWTSAIILPLLEPGMVSSVIRVRRTTPADAPLGSHSVRVNMDVGGWS